MRRILLALAFLVGVAWLASLASVVAAARRDGAGPADAIVVMGAAQYGGRPSPVFRARLDHAATLYRRGLAPLVIVTGGVGAGEVLSEAVVGRDYLLTIGLPAAAIATEDAGRTSAASVRAAARRLRERGGTRALFVSDGFHLLRLGVLARRFGLRALGSPAPHSPIASNSRRELGYLLAESVKAPVALLVVR
jgi:uncharacterized SAM-binding protein YcdF (DUF218 family)